MRLTDSVSKRWVPALAIAVVVAWIGLSWRDDEEASPSTRPSRPASAASPSAKGRSEAPPARASSVAARIASAPTAATEAIDQDACDAATLAGKSNLSPRLAPLALWSPRIAQAVRARGSPVDLALSTLIGETSDWNHSELVAQVDTVARAAMVSTDPLLYKLALRACDRMRDSDVYVPGAESCASLSHTQLVRLDPDNVPLWLEEASRARWRHDRAAELDALYHAAQASRFDTPMTVALHGVVQSIGGSAPPWVRYALLHELLVEQRLAGSGAALRDAMDQTDTCTEGAVADQNLRQLCDDLAHNLLDRSSNPDTLWSGILLAENLAWSDDRLRPYRSRVWRVHLAKERLPTVAEGACGHATYGLAALAAISAADPSTALQTELIQQGMTSIVESRQAARDAEPEPEDDAASAAEEATVDPTTSSPGTPP